jgi:hypothetical protein
MVYPDWSGAVSFGHSACLHPWNNDDSPRLAGDECTPSGRDVGWSRGFCPYRPSVGALAPPSFATTPKANVVIRDPGNPAAGLNLGGCGVDDTVPRRTVRPSANPPPAEAPVLWRVASCRWRGDLSGHGKSMTPACPGAHLVFGPSRLGYARPSR